MRNPSASLRTGAYVEKNFTAKFGENAEKKAIIGDFFGVCQKMTHFSIHLFKKMVEIEE